RPLQISSPSTRSPSGQPHPSAPLRVTHSTPASGLRSHFPFLASFRPLAASMSSSENPTVTERGSKDRRDEDGDKKEGGGGFIDKVKDFIHDIGEKIEEAVGFGKPSADVSGIH